MISANVFCNLKAKVCISSVICKWECEKKIKFLILLVIKETGLRKENTIIFYIESYYLAFQSKTVEAHSGIFWNSYGSFIGNIFLENAMIHLS